MKREVEVASCSIILWRRSDLPPQPKDISDVNHTFVYQKALQHYWTKGDDYSGKSDEAGDHRVMTVIYTMPRHLMCAADTEILFPS